MPKKQKVEPDIVDVVFQCPNCEAKLQIPITELQGGMTVSCDECGEDIVQTLPSGD